MNNSDQECFILFVKRGCPYCDKAETHIKHIQALKPRLVYRKIDCVNTGSDGYYLISKYLNINPWETFTKPQILLTGHIDETILAIRTGTETVHTQRLSSYIGGCDDLEKFLEMLQNEHLEQHSIV